MEPQDQQHVVSGSAEAVVAKVGRFKRSTILVPLYEVTEHQLKLISLAANDIGYDFNIFVACGSAAITILLTLNTTEIKQPAAAAWWKAAFMACTGLAVISFIRWLVNKGTLSSTMMEIRNQESVDQ